MGYSKYYLMKILIVVFFILFVGSVFTDSYGQSLPTQDKTLRQVSLQLELRNSAGQLVTYLEPTEMYISDIIGTHDYLDTLENKKTIDINGETLELIEFSRSDTFYTVQQVNMYNLLYNPTEYFVKPVLHFRHDGYFSNPGDTLTAHFSIIRTMDR